jgi:hypothetical protein
MKLSEMRDQALEALQMEPGIELELTNGEVVVVPNPMLVSDEVQSNLADEDVIATARAVLGADEHDRLIAGGGNSNDVMLAWKLLSEEIENRGPKQSK